MSKFLQILAQAELSIRRDVGGAWSVNAKGLTAIAAVVVVVIVLSGKW